MTDQEKRTIELKLRVVAAEAESLSEDLRQGKVWEGDTMRRICSISDSLTAARNAAANDR